MTPIQDCSKEVRFDECRINLTEIYLEDKDLK